MSIESGENAGRYNEEEARDEALKLNRQYGDLLKERKQIEDRIIDFRQKNLGAQKLEIENIEDKSERTKATEIQANIDFWHDRGIGVNEEEVKKSIEAIPEKEGYDLYLFVPQGVEVKELWEELGKIVPTMTRNDLETLKMPRNSEKSYAIAARYSQEPDDDSIDRQISDGFGAIGPGGVKGENSRKDAEAWESTGEQFMTPLERVIAEMRWMRENGTHLDEDYDTMCPNCRVDGANKDGVPTFHFATEYGFDRIELFNRRLKSSSDLISHLASQPWYYGVRRVITAETKTEK